MKRELAALETKKSSSLSPSSPVLDSNGRKTRSSGGVGVFESLVYKRVKRSSSFVEVKKSELHSNGEVLKTTTEVVSQKNEVFETRKGAENGVVEVEEKKVEKEVSDDAEAKYSNGNGNLIVLGVAAVNGELKNGMVVEEKGVKESGEVVAGDEVGKENLVEGVPKQLSLEIVAVDGLHGNGGDVVEVDKEKLVEGVSKRSLLKVGKGKAKNSTTERYSRRFTRSALKAKEDSEVLGNGSVEKNAEKVKDVTHEQVSNGTVTDGANEEVGKELAIVVYEMNGSKVETKNLQSGKHTRRFTRSASKLKAEESNVNSVENVNLDVEKTVPLISNEIVEGDMDKHDEETSSETPRRKLEMKMSKQISPARIPSTVLELFGTGMLEGCPVYYDGGKGPELHGRIRGIGILCSCGMCKEQKVIPPSLFEIHACNTYKRAVQYIYLENGRSLIQILKSCKSSRLNTLEATVQNAIGPLPEKKLVVCRNCKESFFTMDAENSEPVCSTCVMSNLSPIGPVYSTRKRCRSSKFTLPQAASSVSDAVQNGSQQKSAKKSPEAYRTPKLKNSRADLPSNVLQDRRRLKSVEKSASSSQTRTLRRSSRVERISEPVTSEEIVKNPEEASMVTKACSSPVSGKSLETKRQKKFKERSFKSASSPKPSKLSRVGKSSLSNGAKSSGRSRKEVMTPKSSKTPLALKSSEKKTSGKITRKDLGLHKLVFEDDVLPEGTELGYYARGQKLLDGFKKGTGIHCNCCNTVVSASQFEKHAGCASRRKPYCYIYTSNGVSLHELSVTLVKDRRPHSVKYNDDLCSICADGGNLLLCDGCPRAFHKECASLASIPNGKWYCKYCQNMFEREKFVAHNANAVAAGRVSGVDPIEQITKRSIRIVNNVATELSACILCRGFDFCKSEFGPRTIILCDQCEKEYHVGCLKEHNMADLKKLPSGKWFCSVDCTRIESSLKNLLVRGVEKLPKSFLDIIRKKSMQNGSDTCADLDVSWRLLSGKITSSETRPLLSQAVAIFHESFAPIIDVVSGNDLIPAMVYGRSAGGQEYGGMYCAVLTVNSVVVSAGIFRIFGPEVAELPLVATSSGNHGKGYFQILFACIEKLLASLKVKTIVLPAAEEAGSIWTDRFGFTKMTAEQLRELKRNFWLVVQFQGTSMLQKEVPECPVTES